MAGLNRKMNKMRITNLEVKDGIEINGDLECKDNVIVDGNATVKGNLLVSGDTSALESGAKTIDGSLTVFGDVTLQDDENSPNIEFELDENGIEITGDVKLSSGDTEFDVDEEGVEITGDVDITGELEVTGDITGNVTGDLTGNVTGDVTGDLYGNIYADGLFSGTIEEDATIADVIVYKVEIDEVELTGGSSATIFDIPAGSFIYAIQMINKKAVADNDGDDTYTAAFSGGSTVTINGGDPIAKDMNVKVSEAFTGIVTDSVTNITFTPDGTEFTAGVVVVNVLFGVVEEIPDYVDESDMTVMYPEEIVESVAFDVTIEDAVDFWDELLVGSITTVITSDEDGELYNGVLTYTDGNATCSVTLTTVGAHAITVAVNGVTENDVQNVTVVEDES